MRGFSYFITLIACCLIIVCVMLTAVQAAAFDLSFYDAEYERLNRADSIGISHERLMEATQVLLDYTGGSRDNLDVKAEVHGVSVNVFSTKDRAHMADVRKLAISAFTCRNIALAVALPLILLMFVIMRRDGWRILSKSYLWALAAISIALIGLGVWAAMDFTAFWTAFHKLFFTNDLWLLDPRESILIQMVPQQFFIDLISRIMTYSVITIAVIALAATGVLVYLRSRRMIIR